MAGLNLPISPYLSLPKHQILLPYLVSVASLSTMNPPSSSELSPKSPASLWLQHKDIFHRLYIIENKTLSLVKQIMEDEHQFPTQR